MSPGERYAHLFRAAIPESDTPRDAQERAMVDLYTCPSCRGSGEQYYGVRCNRCGGSGEVIARGVEAQKSREPGAGHSPESPPRASSPVRAKAHLRSAP